MARRFISLSLAIFLSLACFPAVATAQGDESFSGLEKTWKHRVYEQYRGETEKPEAVITCRTGRSVRGGTAYYAFADTTKSALEETRIMEAHAAQRDLPLVGLELAFTGEDESNTVRARVKGGKLIARITRTRKNGDRQERRRVLDCPPGAFTFGALFRSVEVFHKAGVTERELHVLDIEDGKLLRDSFLERRGNQTITWAGRRVRCVRYVLDLGSPDEEPITFFVSRSRGRLLKAEFGEDKVITLRPAKKTAAPETTGGDMETPETASGDTPMKALEAIGDLLENEDWETFWRKRAHSDLRGMTTNRKVFAGVMHRTRMKTRRLVGTLLRERTVGRVSRLRQRTEGDAVIFELDNGPLPTHHGAYDRVVLKKENGLWRLSTID